MRLREKFKHLYYKVESLEEKLEAIEENKADKPSGELLRPFKYNLGDVVEFSVDNEIKHVIIVGREIEEGTGVNRYAIVIFYSHISIEDLLNANSVYRFYWLSEDRFDKKIGHIEMNAKYTDNGNHTEERESAH